MKLPTKLEITIGFAFIAIGVLTHIFFPTFKTTSWNAIFCGVTLFLFPGPQLREKYKQTEETQERWRQSAKAESLKNLSWWASPFPYGLLVCLVVFVFAIVT